MAISEVQRFGATQADGVTSRTTSASEAPVTTGNFLVACIQADVGSATPSVTDEGGNTYTLTPDSPATVGTTQNWIAWAKNVTGGASFDVTVDFGTTVNYATIGVREFSGVHLTNPFIDDRKAVGTGTALNTGTFTIDENAVIVAQLTGNGNPVSSFGGYTANAGDTGGYIYDMYRLVSDDFDASAVQDNSASWAIIAAAFREASSGPTTWEVHEGESIQDAIDAAALGDTILIDPGVTYSTNLVLPKKAGSDVLTIKSAASSSNLPSTSERVLPSHVAFLPTIKGGSSDYTIKPATGAHHYKLECLHVISSGAGGIIGLGSDTQATSSNVPTNIELNRLYIHGNDTGQTRGVALNSAASTVVNCYIDNMKRAGAESQAILGWTGPGPYVIHNNFLEGASMGLMFGGGDPLIENLVPTDITITQNLFHKPLAWRALSGWVIKNHLEFKNARQVVVDGNVFDNCWSDAQTGYAWSIGPRNQDGTAEWTTVEDITYRNNLVKHAGAVITILSWDYTPEKPSQVANDITIQNNLFFDISTVTYGGDGRFIFLENSTEAGKQSYNITIAHNTCINDGQVSILVNQAPSSSVIIKNNIFPDNGLGIFGNGEGNATINTFLPASSIAGNAIVMASPSSAYPSSNYYPATWADVGFRCFGRNECQLVSTSALKNAGTDGLDVGCNVDTVLTAARLAISGGRRRHEAVIGVLGA